MTLDLLSLQEENVNTAIIAITQYSGDLNFVIFILSGDVFTKLRKNGLQQNKKGHPWWPFANEAFIKF